MASTTPAVSRDHAAPALVNYRVHCDVSLYLTLRLPANSSLKTIKEAALKTITEAEEKAEYLNLHEGFSEEADAVIYPRRNDSHEVIAPRFAVEDVSEDTK